MSADQIFAAVGADKLYVVYKSFSDWQHKSLGGIGRSLSSSDDGMNYTAHRTGWGFCPPLRSPFSACGRPRRSSTTTSAMRTFRTFSRRTTDG